MSTVPILSNARDLVLASLEVERIEEQLKEARKRRDELAALVADEYQANETRSQSIEVDGKRFTVYRRRTLEASVPVVNRAAVVDVVRELGMDDMVQTNVNTTSLKAWISEQVRGDDPADPFNWDAIPEQLRGLVSVYERVNAVVKRG